MPDQAASLLELICASWTTQAVRVAAELRIPDLLAGGPKPVRELARATQCPEASLHRLLRALASLRLCEEREAGCFALCPTGELLRSDAPASLRDWALWWGKYQWTVWGGLLDSVRSGESSRTRLTGTEGYSHLERDPEAAALFNRAMTEITRLVARSVADSYDFSRIERIVDLGGGHGQLLATILESCPDAHGVVFDLPHAVDSARPRERCEFVAGSFFESVPAGADLYLLKSVLHNWSDERCAVILRNCRRSMRATARLLVIERVMPDRLDGSPGDQAMARSDLNMLVGPGGKERTEMQFRELLAATGFRTARVLPALLDFSLIEALPR